MGFKTSLLKICGTYIFSLPAECDAEVCFGATLDYAHGCGGPATATILRLSIGLLVRAKPLSGML